MRVRTRLASVRLHPATGSHPYKWARCRAEQVSIAVCAMDATPETRKGRPHAPRPASLSHPRKRGPCSELCRPPAPPSAGAPASGSRLAWRRFRRFPTGACGHANTQSRLLQHAGIDKKPTEQDTNSSWNPNLQSTSCAVLRAGLRGLREVNTRTPGYDLGRSFHAPLLRYFLIVSTVCHAVPCSAEKTSGPSRPLTAATR